MPIYKAYILNKEISVNYEVNQKDKLVEAVKSINSKLESYDNLNGKISDSKLLSFLAIKLQAELLDLNDNKKNEDKLEEKFDELNSEKISLNDKLYQLREQNKLLTKENESYNQELNKIKNQIDIIISLIKKTYEE
tara:strand:+ start:173 stop:580 length:408 start_codon:yes stop_codon:yes gene_type:complete